MFMLADSGERLKIPSELRDLEKKYNIKIEVADESTTWKGNGYTVSIAAPSQSSLNHYSKLFVKEWSRYPVTTISKARVKKVWLGIGVKVGKQVRAAAPCFDGDMMVYDTELGAENSNYQRNVVHHEFFHMIDERMGVLWKDEKWSRLNSPDFKYGSGGANMRQAGAGTLTDKLPGFLTPYSCSGVEEDKAEIYSHLLIDTSFVLNVAKSDKIISNKIQAIRAKMMSFDSNITNDFWKSN